MNTNNNKMTAQEIINYVKSAGISESSFAYGDFDDESLFPISDELKKHFEVRENYNREAFSKYQQEHMGGKSLWELRSEEFKAAGSPKSPLGDFEEVDQYGGENQGSTWYSVKYFPKHDVYIRTDGWYSSYNGTDFNDGYGYEVKPKEKTITVFE